MPPVPPTPPPWTKQLLTWAMHPKPESHGGLSLLHTLVRILLITAIESRRNALSLRASALTYTILLSLVPMLAMSTAVVKGLGGGNELQRLVSGYIDTLEQGAPLAHSTSPVIPPGRSEDPSGPTGTPPPHQATVSDQYRAAATQIFDYVDRTDFATLGSIGVMGVLLGAIMVLHNIELSMNAIWHVPAGRSLLRKITDYLSFLILMPLSLNLGFAANAVLKNDALFQTMLSLLPGAWLQTILLFLMPLFFISLTFFLIYLFFPNTRVRPGPAWIGAICAGGLWFLSQNIYIGLQIGLARYNTIYGSFATLPLFLLWMFLSWLFILGGAQLAFACQRHLSYQLEPGAHSPLQQLSAAFDILGTCYACYEKKLPCSQQDLQIHLPAVPASLLRTSLEKLLRSDIIRRDKGHLFPGAPPTSLHYHEVVSAILGEALRHSPGGQVTKKLFQEGKGVLKQDFSCPLPGRSPS